MTVEHVSSKDGKATRSNSKVYTLHDKAERVALPKEDGWVTFFNEAGYVAKFTLSYSLNGATKKLKRGI